jgi:tRNA (guanine-N7-)-methyltransferase
METIINKQNGDRLYGRVKNKALTKRQANLFETLFPLCSVTTFDINFLSTYTDVSIEIGFGSGEHICQLAMSNPDKLFIGCEFFINGIAALLSKIDDLKVRNIKIFQGNAKKFIHEIPNASIATVFLLFPDPWPKRKHIHRRFIQCQSIVEIYRILRNNGVFKIATDCNYYAHWITETLSTQCCNEKFSIEIFDHHSRPPESVWPKTRYEQKSEENCTFFSLKKKISL